MKFGITGDEHLTNKQPKNRKDDYPKTLREKTLYFLNKFMEEGVDVWLQPGDFFDHHTLPDEVKSEWISTLRYYRRKGLRILSVPGQHDMRYRKSSVLNTPLGVLAAADVIDLVNGTVTMGDDQVVVYCSGWGRPIPTLREEHKGRRTVLLAHEMVVDEKIWKGQEDFKYQNILLRMTEFDLIVTGDNHKAFHAQDGNRWLINCGSLMRKGIDQIRHEPQFWIYDTETMIPTQHKIPCAPAEEVLNIEVARREKEKDATVTALVERIKTTKLKGEIDFVKNIAEGVDSNRNELHPDTVKIIEEEIMP